MPKDSDFDRILQRDLKSFFTGKHPTLVSVQTDFLRKNATQSGVSSPKYYLWIQGLDAEAQELFQGAVRVGAAEKKEFFVTDFLSKQSINDEPDKVKLVFPKVLVKNILDRAAE